MNPTNDIRDIKGLVPVPYEWWWVWIVLGAVLVVGVVVWLVMRRKPVVAAQPVRVLTPFEIALAALHRLREEQPAVEVFYTRLSDIVRRYVEDQFALRAPERTTEEFLAEANLPPQHVALLGEFLRESDLVKFARLRPGTEDMQRAFDAAEKFVRESAMAEVVTP